MLDPDCHYGDHTWDGGTCIRCGKRLRCYCGQFVTETAIESHMEQCPSLLKLAAAGGAEGDTE